MALAVIELYKRIKERKNNYKRITSSADVYEVMLPYMADLKVEECWVIFLNQAARIIRKQRISVGGLASTQVDVRVILHEALSCNATSIHNIGIHKMTDQFIPCMTLFKDCHQDGSTLKVSKYSLPDLHNTHTGLLS